MPLSLENAPVPSACWSGQSGRNCRPIARERMICFIAWSLVFLRIHPAGDDAGGMVKTAGGPVIGGHAPDA